MQSSTEATKTAEFGLRQPLVDLALSRPASNAPANATSIATRLSSVKVGHPSHAFATPSHPSVTVKAAA